jgi:hypothetical protein
MTESIVDNTTDDTHSHAIDDDFRQSGHVNLGSGVDAIPVYDVVSQEHRAAEYCAHQSFDTVTAAEVLPAQRCFPQARRRHRAVVTSRTLLTGEQNEYVLLGSMAEVQNGRGMKLWNGQSITFESSPELWIAAGTTPPTHTVSVSVIDERYE